MRRLIVLLLITVLAATLVPSVAAQTNTPLAYTNVGGQLVITRPAADFRWIVTNPGEAVLPSFDLAWSQNGSRLLFAVRTGGGYSLRVADINSQQVTEILMGSGGISNGGWTASGDVLVATSEGVQQVTLNGQAVLRVPGGSAPSISADGAQFFARSGSGFVAAPTGSATNAAGLLGTNSNPQATGIGVWADNASLAAYWGVGDDGTTNVIIANLTNLEAFPESSGTGVPVTPLTWVPGDAVLLYRDASGVQAQDASCLLGGGCDSAPDPVMVLPVNAQDVAVTTGGAVVYTLNGTRFAADGACVAAGNCTANAVTLGAVQPGTSAYTQGDATAFTGAGNGLVQLVDVGCAVSGGASCVGASGAVGTVVGLSPDGGTALAVSGDQLLAVAGNVTALGSASVSLQMAWGG
jgi:hypothetical protein